MSGGPLLCDNGDGGSRVDHHVALGRVELHVFPLGLSNTIWLDCHLDVGLLDWVGRQIDGFGGKHLPGGSSDILSCG